MKVTVRNLGIVKEAEIELKPLTVFVGPNNTGKTWTANALLGTLGRYGWQQHTQAYGRDTDEINLPVQHYQALDDAIQQAITSGFATLDLVELARTCGESYITNVAKLAPEWMGNFFNTERIEFENLEVTINMNGSDEDLLAQVRNLSLDLVYPPGRSQEESLISVLKEQANPNLRFIVAQGATQNLSPAQVRNVLTSNAFQILHRAFYFDTFFFPVERTMLTTVPLPNIDRSFTSSLAPPDQSVNPWSVPIDFFMGMLSLSSFPRMLSGREKQARTDPAIQRYLSLAQLLEKSVVGGSVRFSRSNPDGSRTLVYSPTQGNRHSLEVTAASSMVKELASLVLYLRFVANPRDWIIIDEPEMNLHPEAQVRMMEFLALLVEAGLQVLFTTHSAYMIDHLVTLMKAAKKNKKGSHRKFFLQQAEAFIPQEQVAIYRFETDGTAHSALQPDGLVEWGTFGTVADRLRKLYAEVDE